MSIPDFIYDKLLNIDILLPEINAIISDYTGPLLREGAEHKVASLIKRFDDKSYDTHDTEFIHNWCIEHPTRRRNYAIGRVESRRCFDIDVDGVARTILVSKLYIFDTGDELHLTLKSAYSNHSINCRELGRLPLNFQKILAVLYDDRRYSYTNLDENGYLAFLRAVFILMATKYHNRHLREDRINIV